MSSADVTRFPPKKSPPFTIGIVIPLISRNAGVPFSTVTVASPGAMNDPVPWSTSERTSTTPAWAHIGSTVTATTSRLG